MSYVETIKIRSAHCTKCDWRSPSYDPDQPAPFYVRWAVYSHTMREHPEYPVAWPT